VDESETGSANFFGPTSTPAAVAAASSKLLPMELPRSPAISQGTSAFLWAIALGGFLLLLMLGIAVPLGTSIIVATVSGFAIFFAILLFGQGRVREAP
jgi:hypothetical protein